MLLFINAVWYVYQIKNIRHFRRAICPFSLTNNINRHLIQSWIPIICCYMFEWSHTSAIYMIFQCIRMLYGIFNVMLHISDDMCYNTLNWHSCSVYTGVIKLCFVKRVMINQILPVKTIFDTGPNFNAWVT